MKKETLITDKLDKIDFSMPFEEIQDYMNHVGVMYLLTLWNAKYHTIEEIIQNKSPLDNEEILKISIEKYKEELFTWFEGKYPDCESFDDLCSKYETFEFKDSLERILKETLEKMDYEYMFIIDNDNFNEPGIKCIPKLRNHNNEKIENYQHFYDIFAELHLLWQDFQYELEEYDHDYDN